MRTLLEYIEENQKDTEVRIKFAFEPTKEQMDALERHLRKYDAQSVSSAGRVMLQSAPLDFPDFKGYEIYVVDTNCALPVSSFALRMEICKCLKVSDALVRVKVSGEPSEIEQEVIATAEKTTPEAAKAKYKPRLLDPKYLEAEHAKNTTFGDAHTAKFIKTATKNTKKQVFATKSEIAPAAKLTPGNQQSPISGRNARPDPMKMTNRK